MASVLDSLGFRPRVKAVPTVPDIGPYFAKVGDSRSKAQIGFGAWGADYPSPTGFITPLLGCAAFIPASGTNNTNLAEFCDHSLDAEMARATALQSQDPPAAILLWQQIESKLLAQAPVVPTVNQRNVDFVSKRVGNYQYNPQWGVLLEQLWLR